jgi:hypothetical protein
MMKAADSMENLVHSYMTTWSPIPENTILQYATEVSKYISSEDKLWQ